LRLSSLDRFFKMDRSSPSSCRFEINWSGFLMHPFGSSDKCSSLSCQCLFENAANGDFTLIVDSLFQRWRNEFDIVEFFTVVCRLQSRCQTSLISISWLGQDFSAGRDRGSVDVRQFLNCLLILAECFFSDGVLQDRFLEFRTRCQVLLHVLQIDTGFVQLLFQVCVSRW
jgi:hypothetical protein